MPSGTSFPEHRATRQSQDLLGVGGHLDHGRSMTPSDHQRFLSDLHVMADGRDKNSTLATAEAHFDSVGFTGQQPGGAFGSESADPSRSTYTQNNATSAPNARHPFGQNSADCRARGVFQPHPSPHFQPSPTHQPNSRGQYQTRALDHSQGLFYRDNRHADPQAIGYPTREQADQDFLQGSNREPSQQHSWSRQDSASAAGEEAMKKYLDDLKLRLP